MIHVPNVESGISNYVKFIVLCRKFCRVFRLLAPKSSNGDSNYYSKNQSSPINQTRELLNKERFIL
jgi:hypothetical protein